MKKPCKEKRTYRRILRPRLELSKTRLLISKISLLKHSRNFKLFKVKFKE